MLHYIFTRVRVRFCTDTRERASASKCRTRAGSTHMRMCNIHNKDAIAHSRPQRPRSFWSAPRIAFSGLVLWPGLKPEVRDSQASPFSSPEPTILLPVTVRILRVKSDKSDWFWSQSIVFTRPFKTGMSLDLGADQKERGLWGREWP